MEMDVREFRLLFEWDLISKQLLPTICPMRTRQQLIFFCEIWINEEHFQRLNLMNEFTTTPPPLNIWWSSSSILYSTGIREHNDYYLNVLRWILLFEYLIWFRQTFIVKNFINRCTHFAFHMMQLLKHLRMWVWSWTKTEAIVCNLIVFESLSTRTNCSEQYFVRLYCIV